MTSFKRDTIIFDMDGTLADCSHRRHHVEGTHKNWPAFFAGIDDDLPIQPVLELLQALHDAAYRIVIFTGRTEEYRERTEKWLALHGIPFHLMVMRKDKDFRRDDVVKRKMLEELGKERVLFVVDDRNQCVTMWREQGLTCMQVAEGDF